MKKVVAQGAWEYTLFDVDGRLILEVVCGTVALFDMTIELNAEERAAWEANGVAGPGKYRAAMVPPSATQVKAAASVCRV